MMRRDGHEQRSRPPRKRMTVIEEKALNAYQGEAWRHGITPQAIDEFREKRKYLYMYARGEYIAKYEKSANEIVAMRMY